MTMVSMLAMPDFSMVFIVETNASGSGLGVVLIQEGQPSLYQSSPIPLKQAKISV